MANGTLDATAGALLWLAVERKASVLACAGPRLAGKSTLAGALAQLASCKYRVVTLRGAEEDFSFAEEADPHATYLFVHEISEHSPAYLWGEGVSRLFSLLPVGFSLLGTAHADTPAELLFQLAEYPHYVRPGHLGHLHLLAFLALERTPSGPPLRRLNRLDLVVPHGDGLPESATLTRWEPTSHRFTHPFLEEEGPLPALARRLGLATEALAEAVSRRRDALEDAVGNGALTAEEAMRLLGPDASGGTP